MSEYFDLSLAGILTCLSVGILVDLRQLGPGLIERSIEKIREKYTDEKSRWINIDGLDVHYKDEGEGPVLFLVHGVLSSLHTWDRWVDELVSHYRIIRMDLPGFGVTGPANFEWNEDNMSDFIRKFTDALGIEKCYVAGNSLGGYVAWKSAYEEPDLVEKLVLLNAAGYPMDLPLPLKMFTMPVIGFFATFTTPKWIFSESTRSLFGDKTKVPDDFVDRHYELLLRKGNRRSAREVLKYLESRSKQYPEEVAKVKAPTLVIWGDKDSWIPVEHAASFEKDLPNASVFIYEGVGHVPMEEVPLESARRAHEFFSGKG